MKKQKYLTRVIAGILSALMCMMLLNMPVYADTYELYQATPREMVESEVPLNFIDEVELQEAGWYKQKVGDGSATFDKFVIDAIVAVLTSKAPGIKKAAAEAIANYILNNHLQGSYYTKYLNSQVVDKCTQNYYYSYDWYSDPGRTNYIGTTDTGIQTVNLCRR